VTIVAYSPLGKGVLTGKFKDASQFANDIRSEAPRFAENFKDNLRIVDEFERLAKKKGCTPGQLSIAWVAAQGAVPIPGTKNAGRLEENWGATNVSLSEDELKEIRKAIEEAEPKGDRCAHSMLTGHTRADLQIRRPPHESGWQVMSCRSLHAYPVSPATGVKGTRICCSRSC
jgi:diketogulonate reductase-like aldo/keto reductase